MNTWISNDSSGKYLYAEMLSDGHDFETNMVRRIASENILPPASVFREGKGCFEYDISGLVTLRDYLAGRTLGSEDVAALLIQINSAAETLHRYLLSEDSLVLDSAMIFTVKDRSELKFLVIPGLCSDFEQGLKSLISQLVVSIDENDNRALRLGLRLLKAAAGEDFRLHDLMEAVRGTASPVYGSTERGVLPPAAEQPFGTDVFSDTGNAGYVPPEETQETNAAEEDAAFNRYAYTAAEDSEPAPTDRGIKKTLKSLAVSQLVLASAVVAVYLIKGGALVRRMLPLYLILAVCLTVYHIAEWFLKKRAASRQDRLEQEDAEMAF